MRKSIRLSKAKNAYDLLSDVCKAVSAELKRINMNYWKVDREHEIIVAVPKGFPACGTVACIGGWTEILSGDRNAYTVLGLDMEQGQELFYPKPLFVAAEHGAAQTRGHARAVVAHIRDFQQKHEAQLKARKVIR